MRAVATARRRLVLATAKVVRWSMNLDVILLCFMCFVLPVNLYNRSDLFEKNNVKYHGFIHVDCGGVLESLHLASSANTTDVAAKPLLLIG